MLTIKDFWRVEGEYMQPCPICSPHRKKKKAKCLGVKRDGDFIIYNCLHCGEHGKIQVGGDYEFNKVRREQEVKNRTRVRTRVQRVRERRSRLG